jgi:hypothetical protein
MFLNELLAWAERHDRAKHPKTIAFLKEVIPAGYRGKDSLHTEEWRLKYNDPCPGLPTLAQVLKNPFLKSVSSPELRAVKAKLRKTGRKLTPARAKSATPPRPKPKSLSPVPVPSASPRIRSANLRAAKARLRKVKKTPVGKKKNTTARTATRANIGVVARKRVPIPRAVLKSNKFNKLVEKIRTSQSPKRVLTSQGTYVNETYNNARNRARTKAMNQIENRISRGMDPFSQSPLRPRPKSASPPKVKNLAPLVKKAVALLVKAKPVEPKKVKIVVTTKVNPALHQYSPTSGRIKVRGPTGRLAYVNGSTITMNFLKKLAAERGVNIKGLRSKVNIAKRIFSRNNK